MANVPKLGLQTDLGPLQHINVTYVTDAGEGIP